MPTTSTKYALPRPSAGEPADGPDLAIKLTDALDPLIATHASGTVAARPVFGKAGRWYWNTDYAALEYDTGTAWVVITPPAVPLLSTIPTTGLYDGKIINYQTAAMASLGAVWQLRYRLGAGTYKWEVIGGSPLISQDPAGNNYALYATGTTYAGMADANAGNVQRPLTLVLPRAGDYLVEVSAGSASLDQSITGITGMLSYTVGSSTMVQMDEWGAHSGTPAGNPHATGKRHLQLGIAAQTLTVQARKSATSFIAFWGHRTITAMPLRVI